MTQLSFSPTDALPACRASSGEDKPSSPSYLYRKRNIYYFRYALPDTWKGLLRRDEIRLSLRTAYRRIARPRALMLFAQLTALLSGEQMLTYKEIRRRLNIYLQHLLEVDSRSLEPSKPFTWPLDNSLGPKEAVEKLCVVYADAANSKEQLEKDAESSIPFLTRMRIFAPEEITEENRLIITKAHLAVSAQFSSFLAARHVGDYEKERTFMDTDYGTIPLWAELGLFGTPKKMELPPVEISAAAQQSGEIPAGGLLFSDAMEQYIAEHIGRKLWKEHTLPDRRQRLANFLNIIGDKPMAAVTRNDMKDFRETLRKLPRNRSRSPLYRDNTIEETLAMNPKETLDISTVNQSLEAVSTLFEWCINEGMLTYNPAKKLSIKDTRQDRDKRDPFSMDDLHKIFAHPKFAQGEFVNPAYFWVPLVGLFTGMRLEEISQLYCKDIYWLSDQNFWVIDINEVGTDEQGFAKSLKTGGGSPRIIPVHKTLLLLGFIDYHEHTARQKHVRLFPELTRTEKTAKYGKQVGKQFSRVVDEVLSEGAEKKSFHSLRHTFSNHFKQKRLHTPEFTEVFGHASRSLADGTYSDPFEPEILYESVISKLDYDLDLSHLYGTKFRFSAQPAASGKKEARK